MPKNICRLPKHNAYRVVLRKFENNKLLFRYGAMFSDKEFGGPEAALEAAITWRDAMERAIGKQRTERRREPSISLAEVNGIMQWVVRYAEYSGGPRRTKSFSVRKYGPEGAERLAAEAKIKVFKEFY